MQIFKVRKPGRNDVRRLGVSLSTRIYDGLTGSDPNEIFIK